MRDKKNISCFLSIYLPVRASNRDENRQPFINFSGKTSVPIIAVKTIARGTFTRFPMNGTC